MNALAPYLETFLRNHTPYALEPAQARRRTVKEIMHLPLTHLFKAASRDQETVGALMRRGPAHYSDRDFQDLLHVLGYAGYGWLRPEGVRSKLKQIAREGKEPTR